MTNLDESVPGSILVDLTDQEFRSLADLVYAQFGIHLTEKKKALVRGRLNRVLRIRNLSSFSQYLELVRSDTTGMVLVELIDRISTNHTFFFREADHFTFFQNTALREAAGRSSGEIRIWCAGCATGEEAYTLAILCREWAARDHYGGTIKILATDISVTALKTAVAGVYTDERLRLVPQRFKERYFSHGGPDQWTVVPELRSLVLFKRLNFMDPVFPFKNLFHGIFCRNVMIYFDRDTKNALVQKLNRHLTPGCYLFIGHSETLGRESSDCHYVRPSVYQRGPG